MKIDAVDFFYVAMPEVTTDADGSQDALVVRVSAGGHIGWGECEASPLASIAAFVTPMSHGACRSVSASVLGARLETPADIEAIAAKVAYDSMDLLQAPHTWSGIEMALWDILGKARGEPVWKMLGYAKAHAKTPYASRLFGNTPQETLEGGREALAAGFKAVKFGWGPFGTGSVEDDIAHLDAAREGLGPDGILLVDAGQIFVADVEAAAKRLPALERNRATWFEEPFHAGALGAYAALGARTSAFHMAGGEAAHNTYMAEHLIDFGKVGFIQIDCGRIGGIGPAKAVADYAVAKGVTYVNHTFTSHLALSASLQPFAGLADHRICEYPVAPRQLAIDLTKNHVERDANGEITVPDAPGLGIEIDPAALETYRVDVRIEVNGAPVFVSPRA
ncbi:mandelate racemase [Kaistia algarum]|uniref:mandelate racemase/muconate lactonizing enzyme family protein n=1 Tax=Kaistia algarum TaxID=2083279 RepID=UPI000CE884F6|nr:mandelate racemase/muconate lactonizing enzyme family protein [Kaistia algarum]MCX5513922.1 mandelate racemase/muconate lactonizing enzyme family protein [Kaistia algarum]PPE77553.1 mandelate racemase [Kaistia algarum]